MIIDRRGELPSNNWYRIPRNVSTSRNCSHKSSLGNLPTGPAGPAEVVSWSATRTSPSTRAGGQDDVSFTNSFKLRVSRCTSNTLDLCLAYFVGLLLQTLCLGFGITAAADRSWLVTTKTTTTGCARYMRAFQDWRTAYREVHVKHNWARRLCCKGANAEDSIGQWTLMTYLHIHIHNIYVYLREFVKLTSSWPPARVEGGPEQHLMTPLPLDRRDQGGPGCKFPKSWFICTVLWILHICGYLIPIILIGCSPLSFIIVGFGSNLHPLLSVIVGEPTGSQKRQKEPKVGPGGAKGAPKTPKGSQTEIYIYISYIYIYISQDSRSTARADIMLYSCLVCLMSQVLQCSQSMYSSIKVYKIPFRAKTLARVSAMQGKAFRCFC